MSALITKRQIVITVDTETHGTYRNAAYLHVVDVGDSEVTAKEFDDLCLNARLETAISIKNAKIKLVDKILEETNFMRDEASKESASSLFIESIQTFDGSYAELTMLINKRINGKAFELIREFVENNAKTTSR